MAAQNLVNNLLIFLVQKLTRLAAGIPAESPQKFHFLPSWYVQSKNEQLTNNNIQQKIYSLAISNYYWTHNIVPGCM